mmetsp:Transcript_58418/g.138970  ORF Transcript_58418/g.138970 Transcript_58418/m.138970 type:complete len:186 (+) Transcript_58418:217-774(+)
MDEAAHADDDVNTAEGLVYRVNNFELEVERFLEVDSWNEQHGFDVGDGVEELLVEEMKTAQAEGESRRARIKGDFGEEDSRLAKMGRDVDALKDQLDGIAQEAEAAPDLEALAAKDAAGKENLENPYAEYKKASTGAPGGLKEVDDAGVRSKVAALRAESELLRKCLTHGKIGDFSAFQDSVAKR